MRLSSLWLAAVRFTLALAVILLFSSSTLAQHSTTGVGGGSSGGGSSSSGGGGSHSSSSGGSSSSGSHSGGSSGNSGSSHSSGGSVSHSSGAHSSGGSVSHGSSGHSSSSAAASFHSGVRESHSNAVHSIREPNAGLRGKTEPSEKRSFFSFLRHPFRRPVPKPEPPTKPVADLRRRICLTGPCAVCPTGQAHVGGGCVGTVVAKHTNNFCSRWDIWSGGACLLQTRFLDDCSGLRMAMEQQARRMQAAEAAQQSAFSTGSRQDCSDLTSTWQSEASLYRTLQDRYRLCQQRSLSVYPFSSFGGLSYSPGLLFDPLGMDLDYQY